jgi:hypothetical protein
LVFPEGRLNPDHLPLKIGTGAVRMSLISGAPILPVGIYVPEQYLHTRIAQYDGRVAERRYQIGGHCYIQIGEPWYPSQESSQQGRALTPRELTAILMDKINTLTYQARQAAILGESLNLPMDVIKRALLGNDCLAPPELLLEAGWGSTQRPPVSTRSATGEGLATRTTAPAGSGRGER